jgi:hypothetical protein
MSKSDFGCREEFELVYEHEVCCSMSIFGYRVESWYIPTRIIIERRLLCSETVLAH